MNNTYNFTPLNLSPCPICGNSPQVTTKHEALTISIECCVGKCARETISLSQRDWEVLVKLYKEKNRSALTIPEQWTFQSKNVADNFDAHVREQLPFYDLVTQAVVHIARHYTSPGSRVYDIGASTGNITMALLPILKGLGGCSIHPIEQSEEMLRILNARTLAWLTASGSKEYWEEEKPLDALAFEFQPFDFAVCFLTFMFFPVRERKAWLNKMKTLIKPGGALVIVDKTTTPPGYAGSVLRRMTMDWKLKAGSKPEDIIKKELSLAGYQRPIDEKSFYPLGEKFFQLGEFAGWIIERGEA